MRQSSDQKIGLPVAGDGHAVLCIQFLQNFVIRPFMFSALFNNSVIYCATIVAVYSQKANRPAGHVAYRMLKNGSMCEKKSKQNW